MKHLLTSLFVLVVSVNISLSQIEVHSNNNVQIGPNWGGMPSHNLYINGKSHINCHPATWGGFFIENYPNNGTSIQISNPTFNEAAIIPNNSYCNWLGTWEDRFWAVHTHTLYTLGGTVQSYSDSTLKKNITPLKKNESLFLIMQLNAYKYDYNEKAFRNVPEEKLPLILAESSNKIGFIAQEVKEIIPELVKYNKSEDVYTMDYIMLIPILVEAMKEQQKQIEELRALISE